MIAGCHSLVQIDGKTFGDPLEQAALMGVKWRFNPKTQTALPTEDFKDPARDKALADAEARRAEIVARTPPGKPQPPPVPRPVPPKRTWRGSPSVKILVRNHFSSALQRMSTVAAVSAGAGGGAADWVCLKGSPEMVATLLKDKPRGYDAAYRALAEEGMRVIALAHRPLGEGESARVRDARNPLTRAEMERDLIFDGFLAFACATRVDTADVVQALKASAHSVMMATGDSALTALHVANEVGIAAGGLENGLMLARVESGPSEPPNLGADDSIGLAWVSAKTDPATEKPTRVIPYAADGVQIPTLAKTYSLCVTGETLNLATRAGAAGGLWDFLDSVAIFARMSPDDKERVLKRLKQQGRHTFMCGDGANDVGALKQAHVGVALLSGFGGANTKKIAAPGDGRRPAARRRRPVVPTRAEAETFQEKMKRVRETAARRRRRRRRRPPRASATRQSSWCFRNSGSTRSSSGAHRRGSSGRSSAP